MKNMFESAEVLAAYAEIDLCYYGIQAIEEDMNKPRSGLDILIDNATGYNIAKLDEAKENLILFLERMVEAKKIIEADFSEDVKMIVELTNIKPKIDTP